MRDIESIIFFVAILFFAMLALEGVVSSVGVTGPLMMLIEAAGVENG